MIKRLMSTLTIVMMLCSCGTMKKTKDKGTLKLSTLQTDSAQIERNIQSRFIRMHSEGLAEGQSLKALIRSDSAIRFVPNDGFLVQGGSVWVHQAINSDYSRNETTEGSQMDQSNATATRTLKTIKNENKSTVNKIRGDNSLSVSFSVLLILLVGIALWYRKIKIPR